MFCTPPATTRSCVPLITRLGGEVHGLLGRAALAVDGRAGHVLGQAGGEPAGAGDVAGLGADRVDVAEDDVVDRAGSMPVRSISALMRVGAEVGRVDGARARRLGGPTGVRTASTM